ncbi:hypothetical protein A0J57_17080 [Sphingobium sp. 22B]|uniref:sulfite exporter TauE/SafE family protein n=1 Tax=unclassified Sphingobium TaxID=2611147 RepID=UPI000780DA85|nr:MULTISPECIES: sulfite exporter TauE/SafE family protein [unclassified Sphingobium]KXU31501.1 hypothetical protein AXW74_12490 [Sphingobium sp. AM]KYC31155.1 hypothetical protein A0J57_17080 [Sphingobium sp. 22B]OAP31156.1 hypothetical protein A8O16_14985 [Sphingobium sp. 20006FA]
MALDLLQYGVGVGSGVIVGFSLGLIGGGGSILAVPLMIHAVGVANPHLAIGTSACAVAANAGLNLLPHARAGHVHWPCALWFAGAGVSGAALGSSIGKAVDGQHLILLFALLMLLVAALMLRGGRAAQPAAPVDIDARQKLPRLLSVGGGVGVISGFFGIGGGFLIVPGLVAATGMPLLYAIGSSLVGVTAFGLTTAANYALSGWVDWWLASALLGGGVIGGGLGAMAARGLARRGGEALHGLFAGVVACVAVYMLVKAV